MPTVPVAYEAGPRQPRSSYESRVKEVLRTLGSTNPDEDVAATGPLLENSKKAKMDSAAAAGIIYATSRHRHPPTSVLSGASEAPSVPAGYTVWRQSRDYLYGWNWRKDGTRIQGQGYATRKSAIEHAVEHAAGKRDDYGNLIRPGVSVAEDSAPCSRPTRTVSDECQRLAKEIGPIRSDKELYALVAPTMKKEVQETFVVVCTDVHGELVAFTEVARGQVSRVAVDVEDVLGAVLSVRPRPTAFAFCHNHPSSKVQPSDADRKLTEAIRRAAAVAMPNVVLLDHLVIGGGNTNEYFSFADNRIKRG